LHLRLGEGRSLLRRSGERWEIEGAPLRPFIPPHATSRRGHAGDGVAMHKPNGFTLVEALAAITIAAIAGSALLLGTTASIQSTDDAARRTVAYGMAQQLIDEVVGCRYADLGNDGHDTTLGPSVSERATGTRQLFDDCGDFNGYRSQPPKDSYGVALGTDNGQGGQRHPNFLCSSSYLQNWRQEIDVYYVNEANLNQQAAAGPNADYRVVEVRIIYNDPKSGPSQLAKIRRVVTYVAPLPIN
jgi:prepilin-type N-terminal cleavage/methylation domain-containing protein